MPSTRITLSSTPTYPRRGTHWGFHSHRTGRTVVAASSLEFDHYVALEADPEVKTWEPQVEVLVIFEGNERRRVLDSKVTYWSGLTVVNEVKHAAQSADPNTVFQMKVQDAWAAANNAGSRLVTDVMIRENRTLLENQHKMLPWVRGMHGVDEALARATLGLVSGWPKAISIQDIATELRVPPSAFCAVIVKDYLERRVKLDVADRPFGLGTLVSPRVI